MIDSGATGNFIDTGSSIGQRIQGMSKKNVAYGPDATEKTIGSNKGMVTHETELLHMKVLKGTYRRDPV